MTYRLHLKKMCDFKSYQVTVEVKLPYCKYSLMYVKFHCDVANRCIVFIFKHIFFSNIDDTDYVQPFFA